MNPMYPAHALCESRLLTYSDEYRARSLCTHSVQELAAAGLFYAGYEDCVRCFHCGLGLKQWRPDDNVYVEHQRYRPQCRFLQVILQSKGPVNLDLLLEDKDLKEKTASRRNSANEELSVLRGENRYLKQRQFCRMCLRNPAREILLPCGDIVVCDSCSSIISHCPSCKEKIAATASIFLA